MRKFRVHGMRIVVFGLLAAGAAGLVTSGLWNALMPAIFGLPAIGFWQALGLLLLSRLLLGGFGGRWGRRMGRARWAGHLSPEERDRFREQFRTKMEHGCHHERPVQEGQRM